MSRRTIVFCPPREMSPPNDEIENEPNDGPRHVVVRAGWWDISCAIEYNGEVDIFHGRVRPAQDDKVSD